MEPHSDVAHHQQVARMADADPRRAAQAAEEEHQRLVEDGVLGPSARAGLLHGRLSGEEKAAALRAFASGATNVLIATTVVEARIPLCLFLPHAACPGDPCPACSLRLLVLADLVVS